MIDFLVIAAGTIGAGFVGGMVGMALLCSLLPTRYAGDYAAVGIMLGFTVGAGLGGVAGAVVTTKHIVSKTVAASPNKTSSIQPRSHPT